MATITESSNATLESDEASASAAATMAAAAAFPPAIPAYLQHILHGRCKYIPYNSVRYFDYVLIFKNINDWSTFDSKYLFFYDGE